LWWSAQRVAVLRSDSAARHDTPKASDITAPEQRSPKDAVTVTLRKDY
jgi:hypothetical protein